MNIKINIEKNRTERKNKLFRGFGMVSANNSSRLLIDYKTEHPRRYREIMELIFGEKGLNIRHLKVELGSDINSSSGTEPCTKRYMDEKAQVRRGAAFILAADAKKINPDLTLDMLYWSEPKWISDIGAENDRYEARYKWFKDTLNAAYEALGLKFDFVSPNRNERAVEPEWIKYCSKRLREERDCLYDFSTIKIVAADEEGGWRISDLMLDDKELLSAVDVIGSHYTSHCSENTRIMSDKCEKEVWFSEGCPPMSYSRGTSRFDGSGLSGINGVLDIADRIIAMYPCGCMTMYEFQPVVAAYYDGVTYGYKQLISAKEPWSGCYGLESGFYMALHFSLFIKPGWAFAESACICDGEKGGDGHAMINTVKSCMTAYDKETGDYSMVICNSENAEKVYEINTNGIEKAGESLEVWETRGCNQSAFEENFDYEENYFKKIGEITPIKSENGYNLRIKVKPYSLVTVSTLRVKAPIFKAISSKVLPLPYRDSFNYDERRRFLVPETPKYTADQGGAFEITDHNAEKALIQTITPDIKAEEWGATPLPVTSLGDDRWFNYSVSVKVLLASDKAPEENFAGVGLRYNSACKGISGCSLLIYQNGKIAVRENDFVKAEYIHDNSAVDFDPSIPHSLKISALYDNMKYYVDEKLILSHGGDDCISAGRAAFYSYYAQNLFFDFAAEKTDEFPYIRRFDDTDPEFVYYGSWEHNLMSGFSDYKRTVSKGKAGAGFKFTFSGTGFALFGENEYALTMLLVDGKKLENPPPDLSWSSLSKRGLFAETTALNRQTFENIPIPRTENRRHFLSVKGLSNTKHTAEIIVLRGELKLDGAEVFVKKI